jgi:putative FmdB family regulatory protein
MPIYAYRCSSCGHAKDVLQKMSDPVLSTCPACGAETFTKQVTAAGFQLKGSGWYVTDFKGGSGGAAPAAAGGGKPADGGAGDSAGGSAASAGGVAAAAPAGGSASTSGSGKSDAPSSPASGSTGGGSGQ